eukprot:2893738-Pyramimonas_sp.AAC.2
MRRAREKELTTTVEELTKRLRKTDEKVAALVVSEVDPVLVAAGVPQAGYPSHRSAGVDSWTTDASTWAG